MRCSISRRSSLSLSSMAARRPASAGSSASKQAMPTLMSVSRPAAFKRGATANPRSAAVICSKRRFAASSNARIPGTHRPARMRRKPWETNTRLLRSSGTTSATVPRATKSSNSATRKSSCAKDLASAAMT
jgi:hypothetical protein